jgi:hypothetical protein
MIQANELRIGDWIADRGGKEWQIESWECSNKVSAKEPEFNLPSFSFRVHPMTEYVDYLQPIPITEEWLLKAGFELYDYEPNEEGDEFPDFIYMSYKITPPEKLYYYTITNTPEDGGYFDFCIKVQFADYVMLSSIQHVHQLQNLYFALTGKELEFKL